MYDEDHVLHWSFGNAHVLFPAFRITSFTTFTAASLLIAAVCFSERFLSYASEEEWRPSFFSRSRASRALWTSALYWLITLLRLLYMLCAMSFHVGLILVITTSLASAHFLAELRKDSIRSSSSRGSYSLVEEPSLNATSNSQTRPRSKSKPDTIFIHPRDSNIARADQLAIQLGLGGSTERVSSNVYEPKKETSWETGSGKKLARALLGNPTQGHNIGSDSDSDS